VGRAHPDGARRLDRGAPRRDAHRGGRLIEAVAAAYREEYGRCLAILARVLGDIDLAEDAVQDAFATALERWPRDGVPRNPAAWILAATMAVALVLGHPRELFQMTNHGGLLLEVQWMFLAGSVAVALLGAGRFSVGGVTGRWN